MVQISLNAMLKNSEWESKYQGAQYKMKKIYRQSRHDNITRAYPLMYVFML